MDTLTVLHLKGVRQEQLWPQTAVLSSFSSAASIRTTQADIRTSSKVQILYYLIILYIIYHQQLTSSPRCQEMVALPPLDNPLRPQHHWAIRFRHRGLLPAH